VALHLQMPKPIDPGIRIVSRGKANSYAGAMWMARDRERQEQLFHCGRADRSVTLPTKILAVWISLAVIVRRFNPFAHGFPARRA
jgi:hypothetical protein